MVSNLLVSCAKSVFKTAKLGRPSQSKSSTAILQSEKRVIKHFKAWKAAGKPGSKSSTTRASYTKARSELQKLRRRQEHLQHISENMYLIHSSRHDRNKVYARMKRYRGEFQNTTTKLLITPVGSFSGLDVLEGFAADAEYLGKSNEDSPSFDQKFYKLCKLDNIYIFEFEGDDPIRIPPMNIFQLEDILRFRMKSGKSCDIYHLTVEHLRFCGLQAKTHLLSLINGILDDIYYLTCPQVKLGLGTALHKGKGKSLNMSNSYRRITVSPIFGAIIDHYIDPVAETLFRQVQSRDQLGFTSGISYLLAAVQRGECQQWAVDRKLTCFGVSLDGEAAFPSVEREIQVRALYTAGERGDYLSYSKNTYKNTERHIKLNGKLSRKIVESKGNRQGHVRASGHFKAYINPCLDRLNRSALGFKVGILCITTVCIADDTYVLADSPSALQAALDIVAHYAKEHQLRFNAQKTKIVVCGSKTDMQYYKDTHPWQLNGETIQVVDNNDHLGVVVSGINEEQKNIDQNIQSCRKSLFGLLGAAYSYKCMLPPTTQVHLWRTYNLPVLLSGLSSLPIRPPVISPLSIFHNKTMRGFLKLSKSSPIPSLHFLLGEPPVEALLHIQVLTLFHNIWMNPSTTVHDLIKYILRMCKSTSTTWANHVQILCEMYSLPSPLYLLESGPAWPKQQWNNMVKTKILAFHEKRLREKAQNNSKMKYLNVQLLGLSGRAHPALHGITNTQQVKKLRIHLKFLTCDFLTADYVAQDQPNRSPACPLCCAPAETIPHILVECRALAEVRDRIFPDLLNIVAQVQPTSHILHRAAPDVLTQFILDCTSINLDESIRVPAHNPGIDKIFQVSRDWCFALSNERSRLLQNDKKK